MRKWSKADAITLGDGADTVTLNASGTLTTADNAEAAVSITNFTSKIDKIAFTGSDISSFTTSNVDPQTIDKGVLVKDKIYVGDGSNPEAKDLVTFKALFDSDGSTGIKALTTGESFIILTKVSADSTAMNFWYVKGAGTDADISDDIIVLLGTVDNGTKDTFTAEDFA